MAICRMDVSPACAQARISKAGATCFWLISQTDTAIPANSSNSK
jgi:hypothetical protein